MLFPDDERLFINQFIDTQWNLSRVHVADGFFLLSSTVRRYDGKLHQSGCVFRARQNNWCVRVAQLSAPRQRAQLEEE